MADIVNLRTVRKRKARDAKAETAAQNRAVFGRTKAEKSLTEAKAELIEKRLDGYKLDE
jgi:hypothetical protein